MAVRCVKSQAHRIVRGEGCRCPDAQPQPGGSARRLPEVRGEGTSRRPLRPKVRASWVPLWAEWPAHGTVQSRRRAPKGECGRGPGCPWSSRCCNSSPTRSAVGRALSRHIPRA